MVLSTRQRWEQILEAYRGLTFMLAEGDELALLVSHARVLAEAMDAVGRSARVTTIKSRKDIERVRSAAESLLRQSGKLPI